jgi:D-glycero-alpha-D-manno-heptose-7-phosphate kinase
MSFFGGGTDFPDHFNEHGGQVLSTSINKYCYITLRSLPAFFEHKHRIVYSKIENVNSEDEIVHPVVRALLKHYKIEEGIELHHDGDLPARSGLGSSSSFTVGLIHALEKLNSRTATRDYLAKQAIFTEQHLLKENVGYQDQIAAAYGGFNKINFHDTDQFSVTGLSMSHEKASELNRNLMLFFTGITRSSSEVTGLHTQRLKQNSKHLLEMSIQVDIASNILTDAGACVDDFGALMNEAWKIKRSLTSAVSNNEIDDIYSTAISAGALGGKIMGAGGGGFMIFYANPSKQGAVKRALSKLIHVPFKFEDSGSKVLYGGEN